MHYVGEKYSILIKLYCMWKGILSEEHSYCTYEVTYRVENTPHQCIECGKAFPTKTKYLVHMKSHTGEKPYNALSVITCFVIYLTITMVS